MEGLLLKEGHIRRSWKLRRFILDYNANQLRYYHNEQLKGTMYIGEILAMYQMTPQTTVLSWSQIHPGRGVIVLEWPHPHQHHLERIM